jgi:hypothetical protein
MASFVSQITTALGPPTDTDVFVSEINQAELPSCFAVTDLAVASVQSAAVELAALTRAGKVEIDRRLTALWFDMTLRPKGWALPAAWDAIAGVYRCSDGWIRLHTNAPHHRDSALRVLSCAANKDAIAAAVARWAKSDLEEAIVKENGAAAAMYGMVEWANHPQGRSVGEEPLIAWTDAGECTAPVVVPLV